MPYHRLAGVFLAHFGINVGPRRNVQGKPSQGGAAPSFFGDSGVLAGRPEKAECPVRRSQTEVGAPFGAFKADRSTTGRSTGINLRLDQFTSPVAFTSSSRNWALWRSGRCRFSGHVAGKPTPYPNCHQFTLTRLPVPSEGWCQSEPSRRTPVGWHPMFLLCTTAPSPCPGPKADTRFDCLADSPGFPDDLADPRCRPLPEGTVRLG